MISSKDPALAALADTVDMLAGQVAACMAYIAHIAPQPIPQQDLRSVQGIAQKLAPKQLGTRGHPAFFASHGVERIQAMVEVQASKRSAGSDKSD